MNDLDTPTEQQLARRLGELAATTEVARDAWDRLVGRTVDAASPVSPVSPSTSGSRLTPPGVPGFARRHARPLLAAAAALAVVVGLAVTQGHDDEDGLRTSDSNTRTTEDRGEPTRRPTTTTSAPPSTSTSSTTPAETGPAGPQETGSEAPAGGAARPPAAPSSPGETGESDRAAPRRAAPTMTLRTSDYTVEVIAVPGFDMYFRRTDGVGTHDTQPDGYGYDSSSGWQDTTSPRCLMSGGGSYSYPDAATHTFTYGLAGADIARIELILAGGQRQAVTPGPAANVGVGGYRAWLVERQPGTLQGIEAFDAAGDVVAAITAVGGGDDFGWSVDTC
jgi:hypothetical protein